MFTLNPNAHVIIMGDFNDEPHEKSLTEGLAAPNASKNATLYNMMYDLRGKTGTHSFRNQWGILDQFIVSGNFFDRHSSLGIFRNTAQVFDMDWLMTESVNGNLRPFRTYQGLKYLGGYSDHLPILMDLALDTP